MTGKWGGALESYEKRRGTEGKTMRQVMGKQAKRKEEEKGGQRGELIEG